MGSVVPWVQPKYPGYNPMLHVRHGRGAHHGARGGWGGGGRRGVTAFIDRCRCQVVVKIGILMATFGCGVFVSQLSALSLFPFVYCMLCSPCSVRVGRVCVCVFALFCVQVLKREVMRTQESGMEKGTQYRTLLIQAIHGCATKFADVAERYGGVFTGGGGIRRRGRGGELTEICCGNAFWRQKKCRESYVRGGGRME